MLLYIIVIQVLSNFINRDKMTKGIQTKGMQTGGHEIKIVNFAVDTTIFS